MSTFEPAQTDFHETWYEHCATGGCCKALSFNFLQSVITTWKKEPMKQEQHQCLLLSNPELCMMVYLRKNMQ
jgi:hypothetical protein